jgi:mRNA interferase MazF
VLVVSVDEFNESGAGQVLVVPLTSRDPKTPFGVPVSPPLGGLTVASWIRCDAPHTVSTDRLLRRLGVVPPATMEEVLARLLALLTRARP